MESSRFTCIPIYHITSILKHFLFSNLFIGAVAVGLVAEYNILTRNSIPHSFYFLVFSATVAVYAGYWIWTQQSNQAQHDSERNKWNYRFRKFLFVEFLLFGGIAVALYISHPFNWHYIIFPALGTILYSTQFFNRLTNRLSHAFTKSLLLSLVWSYTTFILPLLIFGGLSYHNLIIGIAGWLLVYSICLLFDYRDLQDSGNPTNKHLIIWIVEFSILMVLLLFVFAEDSFEKSYLLSKFTLLLLIRITISYSFQTKSSIWYYGILDGIMGFPLALIIQYVIL